MPAQRSFTVLAVTVLAGGALAAPANALARPRADEPGTSASLKESPASIQTFWTPERMARARPLPPLRARDAVFTPAEDQYGYNAVPHPYHADPVGRVTGVLFFSDPVSSRLGQCSASVVRSRSRSVVLTAAHCLYSSPGEGRRAWHTRLLFVPAYNDQGRKDKPYGSWVGVRAYVPQKWITATNDDAAAHYDVGLVRTSLRAGGGRLQDTVGSSLAPLLTSRESIDPATVYGYPAAGPYDGTTEQRCTGAARDGGPPQPSILITKDCRLLPGNSGGPVVDGARHVVAVASRSDGVTSGYARLARASYGQIIDAADGPR